MSDFALRLLERIHGHLGWLAVVALLHPAILLRNPKRRARLAVALTTVLVTLAGGLGALIYPSYRTHLKQSIFVATPRIGWLFERKEHLAVGAIVFAWIGCIAHFAARADVGDRQAVFAKIAFQAYVVAAALCAIVAVFGVVVSTYKSF
jgi:hypothetical protein